MSVLMTDKVSIRGPAHFIQGDTQTQIVWFTVNRYSDGVDLSALAWSIHIKNAAGETDVAFPAGGAADVRADKIIIGWLVRGIATAAVGDVTFNLRGIADGMQWSSGDEKRPVYAAQESEASPEQVVSITELDAMIQYVGNELPSVLAARDSANQAAANANTATEAADAATGAANTAAGVANNAATAADAATANANAAASNANSKASAANTAANTANAAAAEANDAAENALNLPYVGSNGNWQQWDAKNRKYVDSGKPSQGEDGGYYKPTVSSDGTLSWSASRGDMPAAASTNIRGPRGEKGATGERGTQGEAGADGGYFIPRVSGGGEMMTITFTPSKGGMGNPIAHFVQLPAGPTGPQGPKGDKGDPGIVPEGQLDAKANALAMTAEGEQYVRIWPDDGSKIHVETDAARVALSGKNINPGVENGLAYGGSNGSDYPSALYDRTSKFRVIPGAVYAESKNRTVSSGNTDFHYWNEAGVWIGKNKDLNSRPEGAVMAGISYYIGTGVKIEWVQVEAGTTITDYEPFVSYEEYEVQSGQIDLPAIAGENTLICDGTAIKASYNKSIHRAFDEVVARLAALEAAATNT